MSVFFSPEMSTVLRGRCVIYPINNFPIWSLSNQAINQANQSAIDQAISVLMNRWTNQSMHQSYQCMYDCYCMRNLVTYYILVNRRMRSSRRSSPVLSTTSTSRSWPTSLSRPGSPRRTCVLSRLWRAILRGESGRRTTRKCQEKALFMVIFIRIFIYLFVFPHLPKKQFLFIHY